MTSKMEDTFCEVEVMNLTQIATNALESELGLNLNNSRRGLTYICAKNMNPSWIGQRFVFDVPEAAVEEKREYKVRVTVRADSSTNIVQPFDRILGHVDIHFSSLMKEAAVYGWFPLRPHKAKIANVEDFETCGSIKLRLRWVHSEAGLAAYTRDRLQTRMLELERQKHVQTLMMTELFTGRAINIETALTMSYAAPVSSNALVESTLNYSNPRNPGTVNSRDGFGFPIGIPSSVSPKDSFWESGGQRTRTESLHQSARISPRYDDKIYDDVDYKSVTAAKSVGTPERGNVQGSYAYSSRYDHYRVLLAQFLQLGSRMNQYTASNALKDDDRALANYPIDPDKSRPSSLQLFERALLWPTLTLHGVTHQERAVYTQPRCLLHLYQVLQSLVRVAMPQ